MGSHRKMIDHDNTDRLCDRLPEMIGGDEIKVEAGGVTLLLHLGANIDHLFTELAVKISALYDAVMRYIGECCFSRNCLFGFHCYLNLFMSKYKQC
jgi:hypothetical protein